jgi:peptide/nickel transport system ATP-binding protein
MPADRSFLDVRDLKIHFPTDDGLVKSVDGLSFALERGRTLGIVGESGSGKSVTSLGILGLHNKRNAQVSGEIWLDGTELIDAPPETVRNAPLLHRGPADHRGLSRPQQRVQGRGA